MPGSVSITGKPLVKGVITESPHSMRRAWGMIFRFMRRYRTLFIIGITLVFIESLLIENITHLPIDTAKLAIVTIGGGCISSFGCCLKTTQGHRRLMDIIIGSA